MILRHSFPDRLLDEIHRLNRTQQDCLLHALEKGTIRLLAATTENPAFCLNSALLSRAQVFGLEALPANDLIGIMSRASQRFWPDVRIEDDVFQAIAQQSLGDARKCLHLLEASLENRRETMALTMLDIKRIVGDRHFRFDRNADQHFDTASALIKSIRASDVNAAVYYLCRMLVGGEDPKFIVRRLIIAAAEDVGNANPNALLMATSALPAVQAIGMPEARIILSQLVTYLACSPKSNRAYLAVNRAMEMIQSTEQPPIPLFLRQGSHSWLRQQGYGKGYIYPHDNPLGAAKKSCMPEGMENYTFYEPSDIGVERQFRENLNRLRPPKNH